ncbi:Minichromosome maintenance (MCM2/3/5) family protein [Trifolium repens]|nr:Minichromosome maintenance (MCM2/3/5) family protein [Trifolium repens]
MPLTVPYMGFAAATTLQRALSDAWIPALAIVTVCCSITSCIATRSWSFILSNSSMQTTPQSAGTIAPASSLLSPDTMVLPTTKSVFKQAICQTLTLQPANDT